MSYTTLSGKYLSGRAPKTFFRGKTILVCMLYLAINCIPATTLGQITANDSVFQFFARVSGLADHMPVQFSHIINRTTGHGTISDTLGFFSILVHPSDLISISAIGYYYLSFQVTDSLLETEHIPNIEMTPRSYPIAQVNIYPFGSYDQFKYRMINLRLPEPEHKINPIFMKELEHAADTLDIVEPLSLGSPITALYDLLSKEGKSKRKLAEILKQEELERILYPKYNRELVGRISGLEGNELNDFMIFCNFDPEFLLKANDYQIAEAIFRKLDEWEKQGRK